MTRVHTLGDWVKNARKCKDHCGIYTILAIKLRPESNDSQKKRGQPIDQFQSLL